MMHAVQLPQSLKYCVNDKMRVPDKTLTYAWLAWVQGIHCYNSINIMTTQIWSMWTTSYHQEGRLWHQTIGTALPVNDQESPEREWKMENLSAVTSTDITQFSANNNNNFTHYETYFHCTVTKKLYNTIRHKLYYVNYFNECIRLSIFNLLCV